MMNNNERLRVINNLRTTAGMWRRIAVPVEGMNPSTCEITIQTAGDTASCYEMLADELEDAIERENVMSEMQTCLNDLDRWFGAGDTALAESIMDGIEYQVKNLNDKGGKPCRG